ncbi:MAG: GNAT family N-acetyltransferase [Acidimicrobiales bacterium]
MVPATPEVRVACFGDLDVDTLYRILRLRSEVYVVEQRCIYSDLDGRDREPTTTLLWVESEPDSPTVAATVRLLVQPDGSYRLGRVVTAPAHRHRGLAGALLDSALALVRPGTIVALDAQIRLAPWYARWGFTRSGPDFDEDGMPHTPMIRRPHQAI